MLRGQGASRTGLGQELRATSDQSLRVRAGWLAWKLEQDGRLAVNSAETGREFLTASQGLVDIQKLRGFEGYGVWVIQAERTAGAPFRTCEMKG